MQPQPEQRRLCSLSRHLSPLAQSVGASSGAFVPAPALPGGIVISLWPADSPKLNHSRVEEPEVYNMNDPGVRDGIIKQANNIHNPSLEAHPFGSGGCGAAVICVPGGGHQQIGVSGGGTDFVPYFASFGVSTIVLRPRLRVDGYNMTTDAVWDTQQAIRIVRSRAEEWGIDPQKIGVLGFSAGAELAAAASLEYTAFDAAHAGSDDLLAGITSRPDFLGLIYPGASPCIRNPRVAFELQTDGACCLSLRFRSNAV